MLNYLLPEDDGLPMRDFGPWVAEKLHYVKKYIYVFETSMHNKPWRRRNYIDLFSGQGKCRVTKTNKIYLGSPLLALTTEYSFTDCYFVELDNGNVEILRQRCSGSTNSRVMIFPGDSNKIVHQIVDDIQKIDNVLLPGQWSSLNLAVLDPDGLEELKWETIITLAKPFTMDLIIHYSQMGLNRLMPKVYKEDAPNVVDAFFGGNEWRKIYESYQRREEQFIHSELMEYYKSKLQGLGYKDVRRDDETGDSPLMRNAKRKAPLYRLLFASKSERGVEFWQKITRQDVYGQKRLF